MKTEVFCVQELVKGEYIDCQFSDCGQWTLKADGLEFTIGKNHSVLYGKAVDRIITGPPKLCGDSYRIVKRIVEIQEEVVEEFNY